MKIRSALVIQRDVVFAIFLRELKNKFSRYVFGSVWLFLEPIAVTSLLLVIFGLVGRGAQGYGDAPVFIMSGLIPFRQLWMPTMRTVMSSLRDSRPFLMFRQISPLDLMYARTLNNLGIYFVVMATLIAGLSWLGFSAIPNDPLMVIVGSCLGGIFGLSMGMIFAASLYVAREFEKVINLITFPLLILSAVLYPANILPPRFIEILYYNPLAHVSEWHREYWFASYESRLLDEAYLIAWVIVSLALGLALLRINRHRELPA